jgi:anthranilate synthase/aminodeoxychorismate synthase-like glutamine amidotransferase
MPGAPQWSVILVIDNYDSFTYNLVQYVGECLKERPEVEIIVRRNDVITIDEITALAPKGVMLSPGPCTPKESGICLDVLRAALVGVISVPVFGVCLGHEAIGEVAGNGVIQAQNIMHGKASPIKHDGKGLFKGVPNPFSAIRYHSLVLDRAHVPGGFYVTATAEDDGEIMGVRHHSLPIEGVQFHPESILTEQGLRIVQNFVDMALGSVSV